MHHTSIKPEYTEDTSLYHVASARFNLTPHLRATPAITHCLLAPLKNPLHAATGPAHAKIEASGIDE